VRNLETRSATSGVPKGRSRPLLSVCGSQSVRGRIRVKSTHLRRWYTLALTSMLTRR